MLGGRVGVGRIQEPVRPQLLEPKCCLFRTEYGSGGRVAESISLAFLNVCFSSFQPLFSIIRKI